MHSEAAYITIRRDRCLTLFFNDESIAYITAILKHKLYYTMIFLQVLVSKRHYTKKILHALKNSCSVTFSSTYFTLPFLSYHEMLRGDATGILGPYGWPP